MKHNNSLKGYGCALERFKGSLRVTIILEKHTKKCVVVDKTDHQLVNAKQSIANEGKCMD